jgi:hypothetical protein
MGISRDGVVARSGVGGEIATVSAGGKATVEEF